MCVGAGLKLNSTGLCGPDCVLHPWINR